MPVYEKEEILVDSDEACADVERFLRQELKEIKEASDSLDPQWPEERDIWKLANASGGLFAYANTVIRYIGDSRIGSPVSQLSDVLYVIDNHPIINLSREEHPMALLDALYDRILSNIPPKIMVNTRKLLLALLSHWDLALEGSLVDHGNFIVLCNWLGMTCDEAYAAVNHLRSVLHVPPRDKAYFDLPRPFHKSFSDYISDSTRSRFSRDFQHEARQLAAQCASRILNEAPDGLEVIGVDYKLHYGDVLFIPGARDKILLTWPEEEEEEVWSDNETRISLYKLAIGEVAAGMACGNPTFQSVSYIRLLTSRFEFYHHPKFPRSELRDCVFDESRRPEFIMHGILRQVPLRVVETPTGDLPHVKLQFRRPATIATDLSDPWDSFCQHKRTGEWEKGKDQNWKTEFDREGCGLCFRRFNCEVENWKIQSPDHPVVVLFTSTGDCCVEVRFVDLEDSLSEWTYWFWCEIPLEERQRYRSGV